MPEIYDAGYTRSELMKRLGSVGQAGGIKRYELAEGGEKGVEVIEFRTGSGLSFRVLPGRGMDISMAEFNGAPLAWLSQTGETAPELYEPEGLGWLRSFFGGLLTTCGLSSIGDPSEDEGEKLGLHGRISNTRAGDVCASGRWDGDEYVMSASGRVLEASVFGENISLTRKITAKLGASMLEIEDTVANEGFAARPHMILYHVNAGFPVVDEGSELLSPSGTVNPLNDEAAKEKSLYNVFSAPSPGYEKRLYHHEMEPADGEQVSVAVVNRRFRGGLGLYVSYNIEELPYFVEWKMNGEGAYAVGMEPANALVMGRAVERKEGRLQFLEPGEKRRYRLQLGVLESAGAIGEAADRISRGRPV